MAGPARKSGRKPGHRLTSVRKLIQSRKQDHYKSKSHNMGFEQVLSHARVLNRLDQMLASILDPTVSPHCQVAEFRCHCLVLVCSNASFATRIRMISQPLLDSFREAGEFGIERIDIRIAPVNRLQPEVREPRTLSSAALQALGRFAADSGDAKIKAVYEKIYARRKRK